MYSPIDRIKMYLSYKKKAKSAFRLHSPFVFDFYMHVLHDKSHYSDYDTIEHARKELKKDKTILHITDYGAGSRVFDSNIRTVRDIAATSLKPKKYAQLFYRIVQYYKPQTILELGTSLGITTAYMAKAYPEAAVVTLEGCPEIAAVARKNFDTLDLDNIDIILGNFDITLPQYLSKPTQLSLVYIDGNHRYTPTIDYFVMLLPHLENDAFLIFDDIHWSLEMEAAWLYIQQHPDVTMTIDLYEIGIVFIRKEKKEKEHFTLKF